MMPKKMQILVAIGLQFLGGWGLIAAQTSKYESLEMGNVNGRWLTEFNELS